ncbi:MAG: cytochrome P450 [Alphaproteobacteria bacterium]|nr:cytochrome P450 [Alphaproteobacteria bacterium]
MNGPVAGSLLDPATQRCPHAHYRDLRDNAPVYRMPETGMYVVSRYDLLLQVMRNPALFSSKPPPGARAGLSCPEAERIVEEEGYGRGTPSMQNNDEPAHTVYRKLVDHAFRARRIREMEAYIDDVVEERISRFSDLSHCDVVAELAVPVPLYVIADQLGIPRSEYRRFKEWSDAWLAGLGMPMPEEALIAAARQVVELQRYLKERIDERRASPRDDILSDLTQATYGGERPLADREILSMVEQLLVAGNETTTNGISAGLLRLATDSVLQDRLRANPGDVKAFVEETLRYESPVQGLFRYVMADTELGGCAIPAGSVVHIRYAAGNLDERKFAEAAAFDIDRPNNGAHLAFGSGIHHCVGSQLARAEMLAAFRSMLRHFKTIDLAVAPEEIGYHPSFALRGVRSLPLSLAR